jgi:Fic family protein
MVSPSSFLDVIPQQWAAIIEAYEKLVPQGGYLHWDDLVQQPETDGISHEAWWAALKLARSSNLRSIPFRDRLGRSFKFCVPEGLSELLHRIDHGRVEAVVSAEMADRSAANALREEAISSAALAGVAVSYEGAREMLRTGREPRDEAERGIVNQYLALEAISGLRDEALSPKAIVTLNQCITEDAVDAPDGVRRNDENLAANRLAHAGGHEPPSAEAMAQCLELLCAFANGQTPDFFVHPLIRAVILHFWLVYVRPFLDGNGRTARALFQWAMLQQGYPLFAFIAISPVLMRAPALYTRAFQQVETDDNDLTYFILHQAGVIREALGALRERVARQMSELREAGAKHRGLAGLNPRQQAVMVHALRRPEARYLIAGHQHSHGVTHQTARDDLFDLARRELLAVGKEGRRYVFKIPTDLSGRLKAVGGRRRAAEVSLSNELPTNLL